MPAATGAGTALGPGHLRGRQRVNFGEHRTLWRSAITRSEINMTMRRVFAAIVDVAMVMTVYQVASAQPSTDQAVKRVIIRAGHLLDVKTGKTLNDQVIVIEGDKIVAVGPASNPQAGAGGSSIDLSTSTVLPGLIDGHTHLTGDPRNIGYQSLGLSVPREALIGARNARLTLQAGFTTVRNVAASGYSDVALRDAINAGDIPGPRMLVSGPPLSITGGHCDNNLLPYEYHATSDGAADGIEAVQHKVREIIKYGADLIKICATGGVLSKGDDPQASQYTLEELKAIAADAHRLGRKVAAHAHGKQAIIWSSEAGIDSIEHGSYIDDEAIAILKKNGTYLVPTTYLSDWMVENMDKIGFPSIYKQKMVDVSAVAEKNTAHAMMSGVKIAFGTDAAVYPDGL